MIGSMGRTEVAPARLGAAVLAKRRHDLLPQEAQCFFIKWVVEVHDAV